MRVSTKGERRGRIGSRSPQSGFATAFLVDSASLVGLEGADLPLRPFLLGLDAPPLRVLDRGRAVATAALREAKRSLQYCVWPSFAPFSMGPVAG
jgi:hypothetical protein